MERQRSSKRLDRDVISKIIGHYAFTARHHPRAKFDITLTDRFSQSVFWYHLRTLTQVNVAAGKYNAIWEPKSSDASGSRRHIDVDDGVVKYIARKNRIKFNTVAIFSLSRNAPALRLTQVPFKDISSVRVAWLPANEWREFWPNFAYFLRLHERTLKEVRCTPRMIAELANAPLKLHKAIQLIWGKTQARVFDSFEKTLSVACIEAVIRVDLSEAVFFANANEGRIRRTADSSIKLLSITHDSYDFDLTRLGMIEPFLRASLTLCPSVDKIILSMRSNIDKEPIASDPCPEVLDAMQDAIKALSKLQCGDREIEVNVEIVCYPSRHSKSVSEEVEQRVPMLKHLRSTPSGDHFLHEVLLRPNKRLRVIVEVVDDGKDLDALPEHPFNLVDEDDADHSDDSTDLDLN